MLRIVLMDNIGKRFKSLLDEERQNRVASAKRNTDKIERPYKGDGETKKTKSGKPLEEHLPGQRFPAGKRREGVIDQFIKQLDHARTRLKIKKNDQRQFDKNYYNPDRRIM